MSWVDAVVLYYEIFTHEKRDDRKCWTGGEKNHKRASEYGYWQRRLKQNQIQT